VVRLGVLNVDFAVEVEFDMVGCLFGVAVACEGEGGWLEVNLEGFVRDIRGANGEDDVVAFGIGGGGALGPEDFSGDC